jgi:uncharacterized protein YqeY
MALVEKVRNDLTEAMKAREQMRTGALRMLIAALKNEQIEKGHELSDEEAQAVIRRGVKQRLDSIEQYEKANRMDLANHEREEKNLLESYLPKQLDDADVEGLVKAVIADSGATSKKDAGKVMKEMMSRHKGLVDGKKVQEIVGRLLP